MRLHRINAICCLDSGLVIVSNLIRNRIPAQSLRVLDSLTRQADGFVIAQLISNGQFCIVGCVLCIGVITYGNSIRSTYFFSTNTCNHRRRDGEVAVIDTQFNLVSCVRIVDLEGLACASGLNIVCTEIHTRRCQVKLFFLSNSNIFEITCEVTGIAEF